MLKEFKEFIARGNVIDLAVGVIIGVAFGKIVTSLVEGIIMPPIGLLLGKIDFASLFCRARQLERRARFARGRERRRAFRWSLTAQFINDIINFVIVAFVIFLVVKFVNKVRRKDISTKDCPECLTSIPLAAKRCAACCADLKAA